MGGGAGRELRALDRLIGPPGLLLRTDGAREVASGDRRLGAALRPGGAGFHPGLKQGDFVLGQTVALGGHHHVRVGREDVLKEEAGVRIAGDEGGAAVSARGQSGQAVHDQTALVLAGGMAVALETTLVQEGHGLLSQVVRSGRKGGAGRGQ